MPGARVVEKVIPLLDSCTKHFSDTLYERICGRKVRGVTVEIKQRLNEVLVKLFRNINDIEGRAIKTEEYSDMTANDMHVIEAIGTKAPRNMSAVAKSLGVTTGTLTISVNSLVKKGYVERIRSEEDRRVVLVSLSPKGKKAYLQHEEFHEEMIDAIVAQLNEEEKCVLENALKNLNEFFSEKSRLGKG